MASIAVVRRRRTGKPPGRPRIEIPIGTRFTRGVVQWSFLRERPDGKTDLVYELRCDCGNPYTATGSALNRKHKKSCGCLNNEKRAENWRKAQKRFQSILDANRDTETGQYRPATDPSRLTTPPPRDQQTGKFTTHETR